MAHKVVERKLEDITPYERNPRDNAAAVDKVADLIREYGFTNPILLDEQGVVIAGHTRLEAARELGMAKVPTITLTGLTPEQVKALRIADNKSSEWGKWDFDLLGEELAELDLAGFDLSLTAFSDSQLQSILSGVPSGEPKDDGEPEPDDGLGFVIKYNLVFDDEAQQEAWNDFLLYLKQRYPDMETIAERVTAHVLEVMRDA